MPVRVLLVDDVEDLRAVLAGMLRLRGGFDVVAEAGDGETAIAAARKHQPNIVVLDLGLPDLAGHEVLTALRSVCPAAVIVVYSSSHAPDRVLAAEAADVYVEKSEDLGYLVELLSDFGRQLRRTATAHFDADPDEIARARQFVADRCDEWECGELAEDASIVVSELVANAVVHVRSKCEVVIGFGGGALRVEVVDHGGGVPDLRAAGADAEHGRGLMLVSMLCAAWGTEPLSDGKCVWAELRFTRSDEPGMRAPRTARSAQTA